MSDAAKFIGPYRLIDVLGEGGMGVVYRSEHVSTGQLVALKTVRVVDVAMLSSMRREIHELGRLRHPGVVRVADDGLFDGLPWYAMEFIDGVTLRGYSRGLSTSDITGSWTTSGNDDTHAVSTVDYQETSRARRRANLEPSRSPRRPLLEVLSVVRRLCAALAYIHGEGIVHRDLKPDNILVLPNDQPILVDFGIASRFGGGTGRDVLQIDGSTAGTLAYMSPEQIRGELVDARADLYALGCILYELIAGHPPFLGPTPAIVARAHQNVEPPRPSLLALDVSPELDDLVMRLLEKDPGKRLGYADDVAARLASIGALNGLDGPRPRPYLYRPGFAGRREGLSQLTDRFAPAWDRPPSIVLIGGESGIGKTRLMREVAREAEAAGIRVLAGECSPRLTNDATRPAAGSNLLDPLRMPLLEIADRCMQRGAAETERLLGPSLPILAAYEPRLWQLPGLHEYVELPENDPVAARKRLFIALASAFAALGEDRPLLLILDDLQWMDELTLGFLEHVVDDAQRRVPPFGVFGTYRNDEVTEGLGSLLDRPEVVTRTLERLNEDDVAAIVRDMLALDPAPPALCSALSRLSEGNPFFIAEYMRAAVEDGILTRDEAGRWRFASAVADDAGLSDMDLLPLPVTLKELIARRLMGLSETVLAVAEAASVLGREADSDLIRATSGFEESEVEMAIAELVRRHVLEESPNGRLRFAHEKIREVMYGRLTGLRRSRLHLMAATTMSQLEDLDEMQGVLGVHWERAGEAERARACYLAGARVATRRFALAEAERLYKAYLALRADPSPELVEAMNELGHDVMRTHGQVADALAMQRQALGIAVAIGDRAGEARSLRLAGLVLKELGEIDRAEEHLTTALEISVAEGDRESEETTCNILAGIYYERGKPERALELYVHGLSIAREVGDARGEAVLLSNIGIMHVEGGRWHPARDAYEAAIEIQTRIGDLNRLQATLSNYAYLQAEAGAFAAASALYDRALEVARSTGRRRFEGIVLSNMADLARDEGDLGRARALCEQSIELHEAVGNRRWVGITLESMGSIAVAAGQLDEAAVFLEKALEIHRALANRGYEASALVLRASLERRAGELDRASATLAEAEPPIAELGDPRMLASWLCEAGHVALARGERADEILKTVLECTRGLDLDAGSRLGREISQLSAKLSPQDGALTE